MRLRFEKQVHDNKSDADLETKFGDDDKFVDDAPVPAAIKGQQKKKRRQINRQ